MNAPMLPSMPMLSGASNSKVLLVIGVLVALAMVSNQKKTPTQQPAS